MESKLQSLLHLRIPELKIGSGRGNHLSDDEFDEILRALPVWLKKQTRARRKVKEIDASDRGLGDASCRSLTQSFALAGFISSGKLRSLKLYKNSIGNGGAVLLADWIRSSGTALEELHLSHNEIGTSGAVALIRSAAKSGRYPMVRERTSKPAGLWCRLEQNRIDASEALRRIESGPGKLYVCGWQMGHRCRASTPVLSVMDRHGNEVTALAWFSAQRQGGDWNAGNPDAQPENNDSAPDAWWDRSASDSTWWPYGTDHEGESHWLPSAYGDNGGWSSTANCTDAVRVWRPVIRKDVALGGSSSGLKDHAQASDAECSTNASRRTSDLTATTEEESVASAEFLSLDEGNECFLSEASSDQHNDEQIESNDAESLESLRVVHGNLVSGDVLQRETTVILVNTREQDQHPLCQMLPGALEAEIEQRTTQDDAAERPQEKKHYDEQASYQCIESRPSPCDSKLDPECVKVADFAPSLPPPDAGFKLLRKREGTGRSAVRCGAGPEQILSAAAKWMQVMKEHSDRPRQRTWEDIAIDGDVSEEEPEQSKVSDVDSSTSSIEGGVATPATTTATSGASDDNSQLLCV